MGRFLVAIAVLAAAPWALGQSQLIQVSTQARQHREALINPPGTSIGFLEGRSALGTVSLPSGFERTVYTSATNNLTSFAWDPAGVLLYFADANTIRAVAANGGPVNTLASNLVGSNFLVWCVDSAGRNIYCTRIDQGQGFVFRVPVSGGPVQPVLNLPGVIDEVRIDPSDAYLLVRNASGLPFTPVDYYRYDLAASNLAPILVANNDGVTSAFWRDAGQSFAMTSRTAAVGQPHIGVVDLLANITHLTDRTAFRRRSYVARNGTWIVCELLSPDLQGITVGVIPIDGGGLVLLDVGRPLFVNTGLQTGGLSIDNAQRTVAVCAGTSSADPFPHIYTVELQREIRIHPHVTTGQPFSIELPANAGEIGAVAFGFALGAGLPAPPLAGTFRLDPLAGIATVLTGVGTGSGPITAGVGVPADPSLFGLALFFQGVRFDASFQGSFTHAGMFMIL